MPLNVFFEESSFEESKNFPPAPGLVEGLSRPEQKEKRAARRSRCVKDLLSSHNAFVSALAHGGADLSKLQRKAMRELITRSSSTAASIAESFCEL